MIHFTIIQIFLFYLVGLVFPKSCLHLLTSFSFETDEAFLFCVQVLQRRMGIPISLSVLYMTLARRLGVQLEPVNFPNHFLLRWCQKATQCGSMFSFEIPSGF